MTGWHLSCHKKLKRLLSVTSDRRNLLMDWGASFDCITTGKAQVSVLAALEHEFWLFGHPVWLGAADGQYQRDF
ncbi:MAG: hypothetical protein AAGG53_01460 [Cyanobacteria bacterium P01_H01_bin.152]